MILQAVIVNYEPDDSPHPNIKARVMLSDGIWAAMAVLHPNMQTKNQFDKYVELRKNDIIGVKKCTTKYVTKGGAEGTT